MPETVRPCLTATWSAEREQLKPLKLPNLLISDIKISNILFF
jgi:hypothetical protein